MPAELRCVVYATGPKLVPKESRCVVNATGPQWVLTEARCVVDAAGVSALKSICTKAAEAQDALCINSLMPMA